MDVRDIARLRLRNQRLAGAGPAAPEAVVAWFGAMQAQEFAVARWSIGQRAAGLDDAAVQRAFDEGRILRMHALRPTWHVVAAQDLRWLQALTGPRVHGGNRFYNRTLGLDEATAQRAIEVIVEALRGGNHLTRAELSVVLDDAGVLATGAKLAYIVMRAELEGLVASGAMRGKRHTYALVEERAPRQRALSGDEALAELTRRYFVSHGPATVKDFSWWSSLTAAQIRHGIALLGDQLRRVEVDGLTYWYGEPAAEPPDTVEGEGPAAHALQAYDEYGIAYTQSRPVANIAGLPLIAAARSTTIHLVIVDGQLAGLWRREPGPQQITARVRPLRRLTRRDRREIEAAFARYATFAGVPVTVTIP